MSIEMMLIYGVGVIVAAIIGYQIWWHMKYRHERSEVKSDEGVVTDMDYTPPRTTTSYNGKTFTTSTTPAKHQVYIKFKNMGDKNYNHERLYQTVRLDDDVTAEYVEVWRVEKQNPRNRVFVRYETQTVTSPKGRVVKV